MSDYTFDSYFTIGADLNEFDQDVVKNEPMLFNCDFESAWKLGGPITRDFLTKSSSSIARLTGAVVDTRVHMLMPGWYPAIPGFHHDDVPRNTANGQPNYDTPEYHATHIMALVNGDICPTEFAVGRLTLPRIARDKIIYKEWHPLVEKAIELGEVDRIPVPSNKLIHFDAHGMHQGVRANAGGWRWFGRITRNTNRVPTNEIRRQVQVYLEFPMEG